MSHFSSALGENGNRTRNMLRYILRYLLFFMFFRETFYPNKNDVYKTIRQKCESESAASCLKKAMKKAKEIV